MSSKQSGPAIASTPAQAGRSSASRLFLRFLGAVAAFYLVILGYHFLVPRTVKATESPAFLERCRQLCESYGLVPTGRIDDDARQFLEATDQQRLRGTLEAVLSQNVEDVPSQSHPLLQQTAPDFSLLDHSRRRVALADINPGRPKIIVFYYGYFCSHCVAQLFAINDDLKLIEETGATVVAISADDPETTAKRYSQYGEFDFLVLSDPDNAVAQAYGVFTPATESDDEDIQHGTFVVDGEGQIVWAETGNTPFTNNLFLVHLLHRLSTDATP
ncbi:MAG: peroxiredoxin family protein [Planctomycetaceae bacterium]|nr:peroxiredoxin family protein [Planctomycetaceae bacterium]